MSGYIAVMMMGNMNWVGGTMDSAMDEMKLNNLVKLVNILGSLANNDEARPGWGLLVNSLG